MTAPGGNNSRLKSSLTSRQASVKISIHRKCLGNIPRLTNGGKPWQHLHDSDRMTGYPILSDQGLLLSFLLGLHNSLTIQLKGIGDVKQLA
jgi:hypothetical protein